MSSKSSDFSASSSYGSTSDDNDTLSLIPLIPSKVEGPGEGFLIEVAFHHENTSQFYRNFKADTG